MGKDYGWCVTVGVLDLTVIAWGGAQIHGLSALALRGIRRLRTLEQNQVST
jgi:hypothetical protein